MVSDGAGLTRRLYLRWFYLRYLPLQKKRIYQ